MYSPFALAPPTPLPVPPEPRNVYLDAVHNRLPMGPIDYRDNPVNWHRGNGVPCHFFYTSRGCMRGHSCFFQHAAPGITFAQPSPAPRPIKRRRVRDEGPTPGGSATPASREHLSKRPRSGEEETPALGASQGAPREPSELDLMWASMKAGIIQRQREAEKEEERRLAARTVEETRRDRRRAKRAAFYDSVRTEMDKVKDSRSDDFYRWHDAYYNDDLGEAGGIGGMTFPDDDGADDWLLTEEEPDSDQRAEREYWASVAEEGPEGLAMSDSRSEPDSESEAETDGKVARSGVGGPSEGDDLDAGAGEEALLNQADVGAEDGDVEADDEQEEGPEDEEEEEEEEEEAEEEDEEKEEEHEASEGSNRGEQSEGRTSD